VSTTFEVAIVGGGILGLATALALTRSSARRVVILEAEPHLAAHQTGHNSGVIHSGLYYKPGSLKARNCIAGREEMYRFCDEHAVPYERCGKIVIANQADQIPALEELARRGAANGLRGLQRLRAEEIRDYEPHAAGIAGLLVRETGIVDYRIVAQKMADLVTRAGGEIRLAARVERVHTGPTDLVIETSAGDVSCKRLVNCAGLQCDRVARACGAEPGLQIIPFRGEYYELVPDRRSLVRNLIYPVPDPRFPFLGVHFTRRISGGVEAGPNAVLALKREGYRRTSVSGRDLLQMTMYRGFWKMSRRHWRTGLAEQWRSLSKSAFATALAELIPEVRPVDLRPGGSGVRAQAVDPEGMLVDDFRILENDRMVHVLNAPSPAATASITIGRTVAALATGAAMGEAV
jgi:L-2-hydroxyglutarate oxidase